MNINLPRFSILISLLMFVGMNSYVSAIALLISFAALFAEKYFDMKSNYEKRIKNLEDKVETMWNERAFKGI